VKIDTESLLTIQEAADLLGAPNKRPVYRAVKRALADGHQTTVSLYGKTLVMRKMIDTLRQYYYPYYSESHQRMVTEWGRRGGTQKGINSRKRQAAG